MNDRYRDRPPDVTDLDDDDLPALRSALNTLRLQIVETLLRTFNMLEGGGL